ncbi:hypothetical protein BDV18DRAFT_138100 [Aspergillus unguis]
MATQSTTTNPTLNALNTFANNAIKATDDTETKSLDPVLAKEKLIASISSIQAQRELIVAKRTRAAAAANPAFVPILPGLAITNAPLTAAQIKEHNVAALVTMRVNEPSEKLKRALHREAGIDEKNTMFVEATHEYAEDMVKNFGSICEFIDRVAPKRLRSSFAFGELGIGLGKQLTRNEYEKQVADEINHDEGCVLVHCGVGWEKLVAVVAAYMMRRYGALPGEALTFIARKMSLKMRMMMKKNRVAYTNECLEEQLDIWGLVGFKPWTVGAMGDAVPKAPYQDFLVECARASMIDLTFISMGVTTGRPSPALREAIKARE